MNPTEHETNVAIEAAAKYLYEQGRGQHNAQIESATGAHAFFQPAKLPAWEDLDQSSRNIALDEMIGPVWAALQALPDRNQWIRDLLSVAPSPMQFITDVRRMLSGREG